MVRPERILHTYRVDVLVVLPPNTASVTLSKLGSAIMCRKLVDEIVLLAHLSVDQVYTVSWSWVSIPSDGIQKKVIWFALPQ